MLTETKTRGKAIEILLVEANPSDLEDLTQILRTSPYQVHLTVARDGVEALRAVRKPENYRWKRKPDLILLDLDIPQKNGKEVLCEIKSDPEMGKIPLLILANSKNNEDIQWVYEMGANFYIVKPLDQEYVRIIIEYIEKFWQLNLLSPGNSQTELSNPILWVVPPEGGFRRIKDLAYRIKNRWWKTN